MFKVTTILILKCPSEPMFCPLSRVGRPQGSCSKQNEADPVTLKEGRPYHLAVVQLRPQPANVGCLGKAPLGPVPESPAATRCYGETVNGGRLAPARNSGDQKSALAAHTLLDQVKSI